MPILILKEQELYILLGFKNSNNLNNFTNAIKLKLLKLNFTNIKYLITAKVSVIIAKLFTALDTYLYLITNYNKRFKGLSVILSNNFM